MAFQAIPTLAGQAAIAAALDPDTPVPLVISKLVVGDGNGNETTPLETQTSLVNECAEVPIAATTRDSNKLTIDAIVDESIGGFTIREVGVEDENGVLLFVANVPATEKQMIAQGVQDILTLGLIVVVSDTAQVVLSVSGTTYATHDYVNQAVLAIRTNINTPLRPYHIAVKSLGVATPPNVPAPGDAYIVAADATGLWAGRVGQLAQYISGAVGWVFATPPRAFIVSNEADDLLYQRRTNGTWVPFIPVNASGKALWLRDDGAGNKSWTDPFDIAGLDTIDALNIADFVGVHDVSVNGKRKTTIQAFATFVALVASRTGEQFFMSGH
jgi:hypothetical protein